ncbi:MAG: hypothetical protein V3V61_00850 [Gammaproteobacteria bacterium]
MVDNFWQYYASNMATLQMLLLFLNVLLHIIFAGAVAKDAGQLTRRGRPTYLVSGIVWAFATLVGGIFIAVAYWLIHHIKWVAPQ